LDPISHAIFGQTLVTAFGRQASPLRTRLIAGVLGALAPDVDALLAPAGWDMYLRAHQVATHSLAGSLLVAGTAALIARAFARNSPTSELFAAAWLGCLSHIALDVLSGARIQIGWPLVPGRVGLPLVAMAEPWLLAIFVVGAVALAMSRRRARRTAFAVVAGVAAFLGLKAVLLARALPPDSSMDSGVGHGPVLARIVEARWGSLTEWYVFDRRADMLTEWQIEAGRPPILLLSWPVVADSSLVRDSRSLDTVRNFLQVHELGFAGEVPAADGGSKVLWSDLRFCWRPAVGGVGSRPDPVLSASTPTGPARVACALWFGGAFDRNGRAIRQLVKVGGWWQARAPER
jgi:membrane-bound metal-dependent hydrolase YbcI (DUF457 family)